MTPTNDDEINKIPSSVWHVVTSKLEEKKQTRRNRGKSQGSVFLVRKFSYDVGRKDWCTGCGCNEERNLFFEFISSNSQQSNGNSSMVDVSEEYLSVQFVDGGNKRRDGEAPSSDLSQFSFQYQCDPIREKILRSGLVSPSGDHFHLLGCSNSQVKKYTYFFRQARSFDENERFMRKVLPSLQEIERKKGVVKRVKYSGLLFSGVRSFIGLPKGTTVREIECKRSPEYDFTDGCGLISFPVARLIQRAMSLNEVPSVIQIRYGGAIKMLDGTKKGFICKGVLLLDPTETSAHVLSFRESMLKAELDVQDGNWCLHMDRKLGVVDYSQKRVGKLNQQLICLLSAHVPSKDLFDVQNTLLEKVRCCWHDPFSLAWIAAMEQDPKMWEAYEQLLRRSVNHVTGQGRLDINFRMLARRRNKYCNELGKLHVHLASSRTLFGAAFPEQLHDIIKEGQCLVFTDRGLLVDTVIVSRSPSYSPGDVRVLEAVGLPVHSPLRHLRNCILFATHGRRPEPDKMSGGDMDGDMYLVIWDKRLTKYAAQLRTEHPACYDPPSNSKDVSMGREDWVSYVARWDNSMLGVVDSAFFITAKEKGIKSKEATELNEIFSSLVDQNPASLQKLEALRGSNYLRGKQVSDTSGTCVWETMLRRQLKCATEIRSKKEAPDDRDFDNFVRKLSPGDLLSVAANMKHWSEHFTSCVNPPKLAQLLHFINLHSYDDTKPLFRDKHLQGSKEYTAAEDEINDLHEKFEVRCAFWERRAKEIFAMPLQECDKGRQKLLGCVWQENERKRRQIKDYDDLSDAIRTKIAVHGGRIEQVYKDILKVQKEHERQSARYIEAYSQQRKPLHDRMAVCEQELGEVSAELTKNTWFFHRFISNPRRDELIEQRNSLREKKHECLEELKMIDDIEAEMLQKRNADLEVQQRSNRKLEIELMECHRGYTESLDDIERQRLDFLSGKLRSDLQFQCDTLSAELDLEQPLLDAAKEECEEGRDSINVKKEERDRLLRQMRRLSKSADQMSGFVEAFNAHLAKKQRFVDSHFTESMLSESSYLLIIDFARQSDWLGLTWSKRLMSACFSPEIMGGEPAGARNDNAEALKVYFCRAKEAQRIVHEMIAERQRLHQEEIASLVENIDKLGVLLERKLRDKHQLELEYATLGGDLKRMTNALRAGKRKKSRYDARLETLENEIGCVTGELEELKSKLKVAESGLDEAQEMKRDLEKARSKVKKEHKQFMKLCRKYQDMFRTCLAGELLGGFPNTPFLELKGIVDEDRTPALKDIKKKFQFLDSSQRERGLSDPDLFLKRAELVYETKDFVLKNLRQLEDGIHNTKGAIEAACGHLTKLEADQEDLDVVYDEKEEKLLALKAKIEPLREKLAELFSEERLQSLEQELQDTAYEDSMNAGINHISHRLREMKQKWQSDCGRSKEEMKKALENMDRVMKQVCNMEENRLLGQLHDGKRLGKLPVYDKRAELQQALSESNVVVVTAGTGCGKSTQLPQYIVDDFYMHTQHPCDPNRKFVRICCTQPRRLAAQNVAKRVAGEYFTSLGDQVGFRVGMRGLNSKDSIKVSSDTRIEFVTEGWLLYKLSKSPNSISNYDCIIVDETHERNKETDLLLALLKRHLESEGASLKVVVMSATIDPALFCEYFFDCPSIDCPGKLYPVEEFYHPAIYDKENEGPMGVAYHTERVLFDVILKRYGQGRKYQKGDVLIFLSGSAQITACVQRINARAEKECMAYVVAYPLYAQMDEGDKDAALDVHHRTGLDKGKADGHHEFSRKIICCTNIAETSLTVDGVRFVIESGYAKKISYDHYMRGKSLSEESISAASSKQRRGRAGRTAPGRCYYLYSKDKHERMRPFETPKIMETPVDELILYSLNVTGRSIEDLGLLECPAPTDVCLAKERLLDLQMIQRNTTKDVSLTDDGELACRLPAIEPEGIRMILASQEPELDCLVQAIKLAALMSSDEDIFCTFNGEEDENELWRHPDDLSDHLLALRYFEEFECRKRKVRRGKERALRDWCRKNGLIYYVLSRVQSTIENCYREMKKYKLLANTEREAKKSPQNNENERLLRACISGYFRKIAECNEPTFDRDAGFSLLTPTPTANGAGDDFDGDAASAPETRIGTPQCLSRLQLMLARESCLYKLLEDNQTEEFVPEEEDTEQCSVAQRRISVSFILFSALLCIKTRRGSLVLMRSASLVDGKWIMEHAPKQWIDRVSFDPCRPSVCRETIPFIGNFILACCNQLELSLKNKYGVTLKVMWGSSLLRLYGTRDGVSAAKDELTKLIKVVRRDQMEKDNVEFYQKSSSFHFQENIVFGCGMVVKRILSKKDQSEIRSHQEWFRASFPRNFQGIENWRVKTPHGNLGLAIYVNRGNASIFSSTLQGLLPKGHFRFKVKSNVVEVNFSAHEKKELLLGTLSEQAPAFLPECVDPASFICYAPYEAASIHRWKILWDNVSREWGTSGLFWQCFCQDACKKATKSAHVLYVPSLSRFEIFGVCHDVRTRVKRSLIEALLKMCLPQNCSVIHPWIQEEQDIPQWKVREVIAKLGEMRSTFTSVCFTLLLKTRRGPAEDYNSCDNDALFKKGDVQDVDGSELLEQGLFFWSAKDSEFELAEKIKMRGDKIQDIKILLQCPSGSHTLEAARKALEHDFPFSCSNAFSEEACRGGECKEVQGHAHDRESRCCMCRRRVIDHKKNGDGAEEKIVENHTSWGKRLTLCGCVFCRQCFLNSVLFSLKFSETSARCYRCNTDVLARDCRQIVANRNSAKMSKEMRGKDWGLLAKLSLERMVIDMLAYGSDQTQILSCTDCGTTSTYPARAAFACCRNRACVSVFCTNCKKVPSTKEGLIKCGERNCLQ